MRVVILFDSVFGNTGQLARAMAEALGGRAEVELLRAGEADPGRVAGAGLLLTGSPTRGFRPTPALAAFLEKLQAPGLRAAAFDTRLSEERSSWPLRWLLRRGGYAARRIGAAIEQAGGQLVAPPEGFFVAGEKGPLAPGEAERAGAWALSILERSNHTAGRG
jgi:flavodoxin